VGDPKPSKSNRSFRIFEKLDFLCLGRSECLEKDNQVPYVSLEARQLECVSNFKTCLLKPTWEVPWIRRIFMTLWTRTLQKAQLSKKFLTSLALDVVLSVVRTCEPMEKLMPTCAPNRQVQEGNSFITQRKKPIYPATFKSGSTSMLVVKGSTAWHLSMCRVPLLWANHWSQPTKSRPQQRFGGFIYFLINLSIVDPNFALFPRSHRLHILRKHEGEWRGPTLEVRRKCGSRRGLLDVFSSSDCMRQASQRVLCVGSSLRGPTSTSEACP